jgi:hypothetical protein
MTVALAVATQCTEAQAKALTDQLRQELEISWNLLQEAFERRAWAALGYTSWTDYCKKEFGTALQGLDKELRRMAVAELTSGERPMSNRAAAAALGVDEGTVRNDLRVAGAESSAPVAEPDVVDAEIVHEPVRLKVVGADGKSYTRPPTPRPEPREDELVKEWRAAEIALTKVTKQLKRLTEHDLFAVHAARLHRGDVYRASGRIATVLDALSSAMVRDAAEETENG